MTRATVVAALVACLIQVAGVHAQIPGVRPERSYSVGGYVKYLTRTVIPRSGSNAWDHLIHQRFNFEYRWSDNLSFSAGMRNRLLWGDSLDMPHFDDLVTADPGYLDLSFNWLNEDGVLGNTTFDRLYLAWQLNSWKVRAGRQRVNWGMSTLWNPNDLFNVYSIYDFDYEERPGIDALLVSRSLAFASQFEVVWGLGENWDETSLAGRYRFNTTGYDVQLLGGKNWIDLVLGAGFAGSLRGAGFNGEVSYFHPYVDDWQGKPQRSSLVATLETNYSVSGMRNLTWKASVLYTGNPQDPVSALIYLNQPLTARTISFTRWTAYGDVSFDIISLSRQTFGSTLYDDGSWYLMATNVYSLANDWQLLFVWQHFDGPQDSLFGEDPADMIYARIRFSF